MKFIMVVMIIHFIGEVIMNKNKKINNNIDEVNKDTRHPAEVQVRNEF